MSTAFDKIVNDRQLQDHWLRRLVAGIIDSLIIVVMSAIISVILSLPFLSGAVFVFGAFSLLQGVFFFLYASFLEANRGATLGKLAMNLKVTTVDGKLPRLEQTLIRDISKIYWLLWLIDTLIGMATQGDPHQKYSDRWVKTTVTSTITGNMLLQSSQQPQPASSTT